MALRRNKFGVGDKVKLMNISDSENSGKLVQEFLIQSVLYIEHDDKYEYKLKEFKTSQLYNGWVKESNLELLNSHQEIVFANLKNKQNENTAT